MGSSASSDGGTRENLVLRLGPSIQDALRPSAEQFKEAWEHHNAGASRSTRKNTLKVLTQLLENQLEAAKATASKAKLEVAKEQARMEKAGRRERAELRSCSPTMVSEEGLDRCSALMLGCAAGPVMAGMMAGYVDVPITCLTAMLQDKELLQLRVDVLFGKYSTSDKGEETVSLEDLKHGYLSFFDRAAALLTASTAPPETTSSASSPCSLQ
ncbi:unnamed protein product [Effrenium voratum]|uniref:Uncharacterized protein n=1 Tax=Effrenium voratum TaxID=2562239 RepID=A0AA36MPI7_9DINO|nr:unnamed protein product [Effrenium voratum]CAJ1440110.1 unnamed protein product [Effrenium voratum]